MISSIFENSTHVHFLNFSMDLWRHFKSLVEKYSVQKRTMFVVWLNNKKSTLYLGTDFNRSNYAMYVELDLPTRLISSKPHTIIIDVLLFPNFFYLSLLFPTAKITIYTTMCIQRKTHMFGNITFPNIKCFLFYFQVPFWVRTSDNKKSSQKQLTK